MAHIKKNIWSIFYLLLLFGMVIFSLLSYAKWLEIEESYHLEHRYLTDIIAQTTHSNLAQQETMMTVLGLQLIKNEQYLDPEQSTFILDKLLQQNKTLAGLGFANVAGDLVTVSSNLEQSKLPNLKKHKDTRETFEQALVSNDMVLGTTYYMQALQEWLIPLRKAIRNKKGEVVGVMATGLKLNKENGFFHDVNLSQGKVIDIVKDADKNGDFFRQYYSGNKFTKEEIYGSINTGETYREYNQKVYSKYKFSLDELKKNNQTISIVALDSLDNEVIAGLAYNNKYKLWILIKSKASEMYYIFLKKIMIYFLIFLLVISVIYSLFNYIAKAEQRKEKALLFQASHDELTRLPNRFYLYENIEQWISDDTEDFYVLFLDLDNFKYINDNHGHQLGDEILIELAQRFKLFFLKKKLSKDALVVRQGGDEFIILMHCLNETERDEILAQLIQLICQPYYIENKEFYVGVSIGVAQYAKDSQTLEGLLSLADIAMYQAKKKRNSFCLYSSEMKKNATQKADIEQQLRIAQKKNELQMVYQPQINADGSIHGVESLIRWHNSKLGFVPPDQFISVAEDTGLMPQIGDFIINTSLQEIKLLQSKLDRKYQLSINISVKQLNERDFLEKLLEQINVVGFDKSLLTLEITENLFIGDLDYVLPLMEKIKEHGISFSLDDFGTGYSSLSMLEKLPINELKIDKSFVDNVLHNKRYQAMVQSIISMGKNFSQLTLAEGVETAEQVELLKRLNCDTFQGYYFSRPLARNELEVFLVREASVHAA